MDFSPDNRLFAIGLKGEIQIWNIDAQEMIHRIEDIGNDISSVCFSLMVQLAAKGRMQNIKIYKLSHLDEQEFLLKQKEQLIRYSSPDGKSLVAMVKTWLFGSLKDIQRASTACLSIRLREQYTPEC